MAGQHSLEAAQEAAAADEDADHDADHDAGDAAAAAPAAAEAEAEAEAEAAATASTSMGGLSQSKATPKGPIISLKKKMAPIIFKDYMAAGGVLPHLTPADKSRAEEIVLQYSSFASEEELKVLRPPVNNTEEPDEVARSAVIRRLTILVAARWGAALQEGINGMPEGEKKRKAHKTQTARMKKAKKMKLSASFLEERKKELKKNYPRVALPIFTTQGCKMWRQVYEGTSTAAEEDEDEEDEEEEQEGD